MSWLRDLLACVLWAAIGIILWYPEAFKHKAIDVTLWIIYGLSFLVLFGLMMWWNWDEDEA